MNLENHDEVEDKVEAKVNGGSKDIKDLEKQIFYGKTLEEFLTYIYFLGNEPLDAQTISHMKKYVDKYYKGEISHEDPNIIYLVKQYIDKYILKNKSDIEIDDLNLNKEIVYAIMSVIKARVEKHSEEAKRYSILDPTNISGMRDFIKESIGKNIPFKTIKKLIIDTFIADIIRNSHKRTLRNIKEEINK